MNTRHSTHDSAADEQAALWAARLDGSSLTTADRNELDAWLAANSNHRALLSEYCQFSTDLEADLPALVQRGTLKMPASEKPQRGLPGLKWFAGFAFAAVAAVALVMWIGRPSTQFQDVATSVAQRQTMTLADGTRVEMNARTTIRVEQTASERRVRLAEGQAFFAVTKDSSRPFIVETPAGSVQVTGTAFDVHAAAASQLVVTVVEGSVLVRPREAAASGSVSPVSLRPGERLTAGPAGVSIDRLSDDAIESALAWRQGVVVFDGVPLDVALAQFAHHHGIGIDVREGVAAHRISGRHSIDDLNGFVSFLDQGFPVEVTRGLSGTITVRLRPNR
ncbi:MAG: FecR domain-containing protein [Opitutaceae bacterium]|nr:FecR domain-containing protein [Opitutaceae bacterium]